MGKTRKKALGNGRLSSKGFCEEDPPHGRCKSNYMYKSLYIRNQLCQPRIIEYKMRIQFDHKEGIDGDIKWLD